MRLLCKLFGHKFISHMRENGEITVTCNKFCLKCGAMHPNLDANNEFASDLKLKENR